MQLEEMIKKTAEIKHTLEEMLKGDIEPFERANIESALAHINFLYNEYGLDVQ